MQIYNTLARKKEELKPLTPGKVNIYACGPTVYDRIHLGNARALVTFDTLRRFLQYKGYNVFYIQNFTDVDDKIIKRAAERELPPADVSEKAIAEYFTDAAGLNVKIADVHPKVTENIGSITELVTVLLDRGFAYRTDDGVYFRVNAWKEYGKLSGMPFDEIMEGASGRVSAAESEQKESPADFAVWKSAKPGEPSWDAPFGAGRPGWHIECSAMARKFAGATLDIHGGGADLIFPHHENEIAQSEAATGEPLAKIWMHNAMLNIDGVKMAKSRGNFFFVRNAAEKYGYEALRFFLLSAHYRSQLNFSDDVLEAAAKSVTRLRNTMELLQELKTAKTVPATPEQAEIARTRTEQFLGALDDDLNTADALAAMFEFSRQINSDVNSGNSSNISGTMKKTAPDVYLKTFTDMAEILGLKLEITEDVPAEIIRFAEERQTARAAKDFAAADALREKIFAAGYVLEESKDGFRLKKKP